MEVSSKYGFNWSTFIILFYIVDIFDKNKKMYQNVDMMRHLIGPPNLCFQNRASLIDKCIVYNLNTFITEMYAWMSK